MAVSELVLVFTLFVHCDAQFFQFGGGGGGGGISIEDLMGGFGGGGGGGFQFEQMGGGGGYEEVEDDGPEEDEEDLYEILGLQQDADARDIKKAYRKLSVEFHPDKNPGAVDTFHKIAKAYEVLSDTEKRTLYDAGGMKAVEGGADGGAVDPFEMMFGGGGGRNQNKGPDARVDLPVTLEDLYRGNEKGASIKRRVVCRNCKGKNTGKCAECGPCPAEKKMVQKQVAPGFVVQQEKMVQSKEKCKQENKELKATIEKGMSDGEEIVFKHESEQKPGQIPGDVILKIKTQKHHLFTRKGNDLHMSMKISLRDALLGLVTSVEHLDGHTVKVQRTGTTQPMQTIRIRGEGMPVHNYPSSFGDLVITFQVDFPRQLDDSQKEAFAKVWPKTALSLD